MAAQDKDERTLIKNVSIFDGSSEQLIIGQDLVLAGNKIDKLAKSGGEEDAYDAVIDGGGGTLMPGLIDAHTHLAICASIPQMMTEYVHADEGIKHALDAGIKSIEHGMLIKEDTMKRLVDEDAWLCPQAFIVMQPIDGNPTFTSPIQRAKMKKAQEGAVNEFRWAKQYGAKVAWGTDMFGARAAFDATLREFEFRAQFYGNVEQLQQVTGNNGQLVALSGKKNPYPEAKLGVIEHGAYADLLIVDGNPLEDIMVMVDHENNFKMIIKDGKVYKNTL